MTSYRDRRGRVVVLTLLCLTFVSAQVLMEDGPLIFVDFAVQRLRLEQRWPELYPLAKAFELLGQRGLVYVIAAIIAGWLAWRARTWRPMIVLAGSLLTLNLVVGATKVLTGRRKPFTGDIGVFEGGIIFPSGHAANVVLTWGVVCYLLLRYSQWRFPRRSMTAGVVLASVAMAAASLYLGTHWVTDLLAGGLVGALILEGAVLLDARFPLPRRRHPAQPPALPREPIRVAHVRREPAGSYRASPLAPAGSRAAVSRKRPSPDDQPEPTREVADG